MVDRRCKRAPIPEIALGDSFTVWAVGVYRLWRDVGFAVGAVLAGVIADLYSITTAIVAVAAITAASGLYAALRMRETMKPAPSVGRPGPRVASA